MAKPIYVCSGSHCRKRKSELKALVSCLRKGGKVRGVKCQKICKGPVVGLEVKGSLQWFRKVDSKKDGKALLRITVGKDKKPKKPLAKKLAKKRKGKLRK